MPKNKNSRLLRFLAAGVSNLKDLISDWTAAAMVKASVNAVTVWSTILTPFGSVLLHPPGLVPGLWRVKMFPSCSSVMASEEVIQMRKRTNSWTMRQWNFGGGGIRNELDRAQIRQMLRKETIMWRNTQKEWRVRWRSEERAYTNRNGCWDVLPKVVACYYYYIL